MPTKWAQRWYCFFFVRHTTRRSRFGTRQWQLRPLIWSNPIPRQSIDNPSPPTTIAIAMPHVPDNPPIEPDVPETAQIRLSGHILLSAINKSD
jgi:hypothetical protein